MLKSLLKRIVPTSIWARAREWSNSRNHARALTQFPRRQVEHTYCGHRLRITLGDNDGAEWYDKDWPSFPGLDLLASSRLVPGARVFDIGAHQGIVALVLARTVGPIGSVVAVEPHPLNIELMERNRSLNGADNLTIRQSVCGDNRGSVRMGHNLNDRVRSDREYGGYRVQSETLEDLAAEFGAPDVAFIDVEGHEIRVLQGATKILAGYRTDWFIEIHVGVGLEAAGGSVEELMSYFPSKNYELFVGSDATPEFVPVSAGARLLQSRCYLAALGRRPQATTT